MGMKIFDKIASAAITGSAIFSMVVALTSWDWFPIPGQWGDIAHIPNTIINHVALLLPPVTVLLYLIVRRFIFKRPF